MTQPTRQLVALLATLAFAGAALLSALLLPEHLAPSAEVADRLPTYIGIVGYRFESRAARSPTPSPTKAPPKAGAAAPGHPTVREVVVDLGPPSAAPTTRAPRAAARPFLGLPWLAEDDPTLTLRARCAMPSGRGARPGAPPRCTLSLEAADPHTRPTTAVWELSTPSGRQSWPAVALKAGDTLALSPRTAGPRDPDRELTLAPAQDAPAGERWSLGGCTLPEPNPEARVALLDLFHTAPNKGAATPAACAQRALDSADGIEDRWIKPTGTGGYRVPLRSFVRVANGDPELVLMADPGYGPVLVNGAAPAPTKVEATLQAGQMATLNVAGRRFRTRRRGEEHAQACIKEWEPDCRRLDVFLVRHGLQLRVHDDASLEVTLDEDSAALRAYSHVALQPHELRHEGRPIRLVYAHGTGAAARLAPLAGKPGVRELHVPFAVLGGLSYTATLRLRREGDALNIRFRDGAQAMVFDEPGRFEGGSLYHPLFEIDVARAPHGLARGLAWPFVLLAVLALLAVALGRRSHALRRVAVFVAASSWLLAMAACLHALVAFSVFTQRPWDWEAFDQLVVAGVARPAAVVLGLALGAAWVGWGPAKSRGTRHPGWAFGALGVAVILGLVRLAMGGYEAIGPIRVAAFVPALLAVHALWFGWSAGLSGRVRWLPGQRVHWFMLGACGLLIGLSALAWWRDKGAMLLVVIPLAAMAVVSLVRQGWQASGATPVSYRGARPGRWLWAAALLGIVGVGGLIHGTRPLMRAYAGMALPAVDVVPTSFCEGRRVSQQSLDAACGGAVVAGQPALATMAAGGLLDDGVNRRHKVRFLDWTHDGRPEGRCHAADRLPIQSGVEVGFFRALSRRYLATPDAERAYLRAGLVDFGPGTTNSLLDDYLAVVQVAPQFPQLTLSLLCLIAAGVWLLGLWLTTPAAPLSAAQLTVVGLSTLLFGGLFLTVAANLDVWPNFAQSIPLLAVRSHSAWLLDSLALGLLMAAFVVRCHATPQPGADVPPFVDRGPVRGGPVRILSEQERAAAALDADGGSDQRAPNDESGQGQVRELPRLPAPGDGGPCE